MADDCEPVLRDTSRKCNFICGVVEGFYGRPWTTDQRKDLFQKMKRWGMDSYVYAPKDDYKHRAYWRELYTVEEAEHLTGLINAAKSQGIEFYYALSPGLDITYSNQKEIATLKRKLEQVSQFGCTAFALLFDDIEPEMSEADKEIFQSFAHAQVSVTNEVQQHLGGSTVRFLLCPTQYCGTRAMPTVSSSEYLTTLGSKLSKDIDIMWTGPKVISKTLTVACIEEITTVLRRPPVIWDNLHANDYDQKRMFLGPYVGRSPELIPLLRGVLSNPNCEYNANTVPIRTLAHWANCSVDASTNIDSVASDIKLEQEGGGTDCNDEGPVALNKHVYHHRQALRNAVMEWLPEFSIKKISSGPMVKPQPIVNVSAVPILPILPMVNTCMSLTSTTTTPSQGTNSVPTLNTAHLQALADVCTTVSSTENFNPVSNPVMNSLVSATKVVTNDSIPNPIPPLVTSNLSLPSEIPISTIPIPIMEIKNSNASEKPNVVEAEMLETSPENEVDNTSSLTTNVTVTSNNQQNQICNVSDCLNIRVSHVENKLQPTKEEPKSEQDIDNGINIIVDDCDIDSHSNKDLQNGPMSVGESPVTLSPSHVVESAMECTPENETQTSKSDSTEKSQFDKQENISQDIDVVMVDNDENMEMHTEYNVKSDGEMIIEDSCWDESESTDNLTLDDLMLLCDLFYLPFEHGSQGIKLLQEFNWLKCNATVLLTTNKDSKSKGYNKSERQEWYFRAKKFTALSNRVSRLSRRLGKCLNQELAHDLCGYLWDLRVVVGLLHSFVQWLALGKFPPNICNYTQGSYTWFSKGWKEAFMSGDQEPWVFRGGLTVDLQRLLPIDNGNDLLAYKPPETPDSVLYTIRPYTEKDKKQVCTVCNTVTLDALNCINVLPPELTSLPEDRLVEPFISLYPELCMVVEEEEGLDKKIVGYAFAVPDTKLFEHKIDTELKEIYKTKYSIDHLDNPDLPTSVKDWIGYFHDAKSDRGVPEIVLRHHPASISVNISSHSRDPSAPKRLVTCLLAALRANGIFGVHVCIPATDHCMRQFYLKLGFMELSQDTASNKTYLGRNF